VYDELRLGRIYGRQKYFEKNFILSASKKGIDPLLQERALHCLEYIAQLNAAGFDFVFKGGTACQLLTAEDLQRLSIDVDISADIGEKELEKIVGDICLKFGGKVYKYYKVPKKGLDKVPLAMFNIEAPTYFPAQKAETMIKLDAVLHKPEYELVKSKLKTFYYDSDVRVATPTANSMLGDKLSAIGPNTIGIPLARAIDCIKQFYDIDNLLRISTDLHGVADAYRKCFAEVSAFRDLKIDIGDALADLANTCKIMTAVPYVPPWVRDKTLLGDIESISNAVAGFTGYLTKNNRLSKRKLREMASRTALLSKFVQLELKGKSIPDALKLMKGLEANLQNVLSAISKIEDRLRKIPEKERWHLYIKEFRGAPIAMLCWYGYWYPDEFVELMER